MFHHARLLEWRCQIRGMYVIVQWYIRDRGNCSVVYKELSRKYFVRRRKKSVVPQHKLVVADFRFWIRVQRDKRAKVARTEWWKLKGEVAQAFKEKVIKEGPGEEGGDADNV